LINAVKTNFIPLILFEFKSRKPMTGLDSLEHRPLPGIEKATAFFAVGAEAPER
jgi:hypothetical protein